MLRKQLLLFDCISLSIITPPDQSSSVFHHGSPFVLDELALFSVDYFMANQRSNNNQ
jgi:hypothetical protein